jgi:hypothetical protein
MGIRAFVMTPPFLRIFAEPACFVYTSHLESPSYKYLAPGCVLSFMFALRVWLSA